MFCSFASHSFHASRQVERIGQDLEEIDLGKDFILKPGDIIISWTPTGASKATAYRSEDSSEIKLKIGGVLVRMFL